jgi:hypothetical protein
MPSTLPILPPGMAEELVRKQAAKDPRATAGAVIGTSIDVGTSIMAGVGIAKKSPATVYVATGIQVAKFIMDQAKGRSPNPQIAISRQMPDLVLINPGPAGCASWEIFTGLVHDPRTQYYGIGLPPLR